MKKPPPIALLTDFGTSDAYVASMKGVLHAKIPGVITIDISHSVPPQDIQHAAYLLWSSYRYFPAGTIFVAIVDPGVGSHRRVLIGKIDGYVFVFPDNGILDLVNQTATTSSFFEVNIASTFSSASKTFHGRDIFAPIAAYIASGKPLRSIGTRISVTLHQKKFIDISVSGKSKFVGDVIHIDSFGNIITNFMTKGRLKTTASLTLRQRKRITHVYQTYHEAKTGIPFMIIGSMGLVEVSVKNSNAAKLLRINRNDSVTLTL